MDRKMIRVRYFHSDEPNRVKRQGVLWLSMLVTTMLQ
jgi:hypothetical protein